MGESSPGGQGCPGPHCAQGFLVGTRTITEELPRPMESGFVADLGIGI